MRALISVTIKSVKMFAYGELTVKFKYIFEQSILLLDRFVPLKSHS